MSNQSCPFCGIASGQVPAHIVYKDDYCVAFLDTRPLFPGHTLLIPFEHVSTLDQMTFPWAGHFFQILCTITKAVEVAMGAQGTFVAANNKVSQSVPHLHFHIVPRNKGDGLKGFFWPRHLYENEDAMSAAAEKIRDTIRAALI